MYRLISFAECQQGLHDHSRSRASPNIDLSLVVLFCGSFVYALLRWQAALGMLCLYTMSRYLFEHALSRKQALRRVNPGASCTSQHTTQKPRLPHQHADGGWCPHRHANHRLMTTPHDQTSSVEGSSDQQERRVGARQQHCDFSLFERPQSKPLQAIFELRVTMRR